MTRRKLEELTAISHDIDSLDKIVSNIQRIEDDGIHYDSDVMISHEDFMSDEIFLQTMQSIKPVFQSILEDLKFKFEKA